MATGLHARGFGPGDKVALLIPNVPEFTIAYFGILYAGCTVVPLNVLLSAPEVAEAAGEIREIRGRSFRYPSCKSCC